MKKEKSQSYEEFLRSELEKYERVSERWNKASRITTLVSGVLLGVSVASVLNNIKWLAWTALVLEIICVIISGVTFGHGIGEYHGEITTHLRNIIRRQEKMDDDGIKVYNSKEKPRGQNKKGDK